MSGSPNRAHYLCRTNIHYSTLIYSVYDTTNFQVSETSQDVEESTMTIVILVVMKVTRRTRNVSLLPTSILPYKALMIVLLGGWIGISARVDAESSSQWWFRRLRGGAKENKGYSPADEHQDHCHRRSILLKSAPRRACGLYVWDLPSAILYHWCSHLMKDCVYEGRGGRKVCF